MYRLSAAFGGRTGFRRWRGSKRTKVLHRTETSLSDILGRIKEVQLHVTPTKTEIILNKNDDG